MVLQFELVKVSNFVLKMTLKELPSDKCVHSYVWFSADYLIKKNRNSYYSLVFDHLPGVIKLQQKDPLT